MKLSEHATLDQAKAAAKTARERYLSVIPWLNPKTGQYEVRAGRPKTGKKGGKK
jgi:uncharacterized lipoprotein YddW (UPF0748 family)